MESLRSDFAEGAVVSYSRIRHNTFVLACNALNCHQTFFHVYFFFASCNLVTYDLGTLHRLIGQHRSSAIFFVVEKPTQLQLALQVSFLLV